MFESDDLFLALYPPFWNGLLENLEGDHMTTLV